MPPGACHGHRSRHRTVSLASPYPVGTGLSPPARVALFGLSKQREGLRSVISPPLAPCGLMGKALAPVVQLGVSRVGYTPRNMRGRFWGIQVSLARRETIFCAASFFCPFLTPSSRSPGEGSTVHPSCYNGYHMVHLPALLRGWL